MQELSDANKYTYDQVFQASLDYFNGDDLAAKVFVDKYALQNNEGEYLELTPKNMHHRLAKELARIESKYPNPMSEEEIFDLLDKFKYVVPQGSPMSGIGNPFILQSLGNCFTIESPLDSYGSLLKADQELAQLMKRRAGVGLDISNIRPKNMPTSNAAKTTDGIAVFMERFSNTCREVAQCIAEDQKVLTKRGLVKIKDVKSNQDFVWTRIGWIKVIEKIQSGKKKIVEITTKEGFSIKTSPDHIFLTGKNGDVVEQKVSNFKIGDSIITIPGVSNIEKENLILESFTYAKKTDGNCSNRLNESVILPKILNEDLAYLLGYSYGDGHIEYDRNNKPKLLDLACGHNWPKIEQKIIKIIDNLFNYSACIRDGNGAVNRITINSKIILGWLQKNSLLKEKSFEIKMPQKILDSSTKIQMAFLSGFFDADGYASGKKKGYVFSTVCKQFAKDIQTILMANGMISNLHEEDRSAKKWRNLFNVCVVGKYSQTIFLNLFKNNSIKVFNCNFIAKRDNHITPFLMKTLKFEKTNYINIYKKLSIAAFYRYCNEKQINNENVLVNSIIQSIEEKNECNTYDLVLEKEHLFWCEGFYVHNSGRRGAEIMTCSVHHPEIETFLTIKRDLKKVTGANISSRFSNSFMQAVENNLEYEQRWPIEDKIPKISKLVAAKKVWNIFIESNWLSAEPGAQFSDHIYDYSPADIYQSIHKKWKSTTSNPCSELSMGKDSCRLLLLNLYSFVNNPFQNNSEFDFTKFSEITVKAQRLMDDIIDLEIECIDKIIKKIKSDPEPDDVKSVELNLWQGYKETAIEGRRTGLGVTAEGDCLAALNIRYGSEESLKITDEIFKYLAINAYKSTCIMAKERGPFPIFSFELEKNHIFLERIWNESPEVYELYKKYGRRNIALTTIAPAGSVSILTQTTSGIEPVFLLSYKRRKKINPNDKNSRIDFVDQSGDSWQEFNVNHHHLNTWMKVTGKTNIEESPYWKATSADCDWKMSVKLQAAAQKWICHSISKTCNVPADASQELISEIYMTAWKEGCKGFTVYRDGCRSGVLVGEEVYKQQKQLSRPEFISDVMAPKRPKELLCEIHHISYKGNKWVALVGLLRSKPYELFIGKSETLSLPSKLKNGRIVKIGKGKYDLHLDLQGEDLIIKDIIKTFDNQESAWATRMISTSLRHGVPVEFLSDQLSKEGDVTDFNKVMSRILKKYIKEGDKVKTNEKCPQCSSSDLIYQEGCKSCKSCFWSKC